MFNSSGCVGGSQRYKEGVERHRTWTDWWKGQVDVDESLVLINVCSLCVNTLSFFGRELIQNSRRLAC